MALRIDLADPSAEGMALAAGLRAAGYEVALRAVEDVSGTRADGVVLAGDASDALSALRALRDDGASPDTPVVLLGTPAGTGHRGEGGAGFGAQAVLLRPVGLGALIDALESVLSSPDAPRSRTLSRRETTLEIAHSPEQTGMRPSASRDLDASSGIRPELTMPLPGSIVEETGADPARDLDFVPSAIAPFKTSSSQKTPATGPGELLSPSSPGSVRAKPAAISERLRALLEAADRRAFPNRPAIDFSLPGGDEPAAELVPAELLDHEELLLDVLPSDDDPIDAFTFVGGPVLPGASFPDALLPSHAGDERAEPAEAENGRRKTSPGTPTSLSRRPPAPSQSDDSREPVGSIRPPTQIDAEAPSAGWDAPPASTGDTGVHEARVRPGSIAPLPKTTAGSEWPEEDSVLGRVSPEGGRRGSLGEGGALRLLLRVAELRLDARLTIAAPDAETITIVVTSGELAGFEGAAALHAIDALARRGADVPSAADEAGARRALEEAVARDAITMLERDRALREGRERLLAALLARPRASFTLVRLDPQELPPRGPSPLGAPLRLAILEAARRGIDRSRAHAILGTDVGLRRTARFDAIAAEGLIAPEIAALLIRREGATLDRVLDDAPGEPGLAGLIATLIAAGALSTHPVALSSGASAAAGENDGERARHARRVLEEAAAVAEDADYFRILGVAIDASERDLQQAARARRTQLESLELDGLGLGPLEPLRRAVLDAIDEASRVLSNPRWRGAYATALAHAPNLASPSGEHYTNTR